MIKYKVQYGQSMWDVAIQRYGHAAGVFVLVEDNPQYAITDVPVPGSELLIRPVVPKLSETNEAVVREYVEKRITVASSSALRNPLLNIDNSPLLNIDGTPLFNIQ
jgi:hypothetical protein